MLQIIILYENQRVPKRNFFIIYFDHIFLNKFTHPKLKITITDIETKNYVSEKSDEKVKNDTTGTPNLWKKFFI